MTELGRLGRYRLLRRIAVGGVAEVYLASAEGLAGFAKRVVIKRLHPEHARDAALVSMFVDEARLGALLHHPHIVEVYDIGTENGDYFIVMEHVPGRDLRDLLDARPDQPLSLAAALAIVQAVAAGLHHAHEQRDPQGQLLGVVHRDVSPANVLLGWDGSIKLSDFGVAKWAAQRSQTEQGTLKGKLGYMSPEQCRGDVLDRRSDVFALGVLLYELTTGERPFRVASDFETLSAIVAGRYQPPSVGRPDYPPALEAIVQRTLETDPDRRFPDVAAVGAALAELAGALGSRGSAADVAQVLRERFPGAETTPAPVDEPAPALPASADRTRTDAASPAAAAAAAAARRRRQSPARVLVLAGLGTALAAGAVAAVFALAPPSPPPASVRSPLPMRPVSRAPAPPPPAAATSPAPPAARTGTAPPGSPSARRRPSVRPRPPDGQVLWDPDSARLP